MKDVIYEYTENTLSSPKWYVLRYDNHSATNGLFLLINSTDSGSFENLYLI